MPNRACALALAALLAALTLAAGCTGAPERAEGTVRYRDPKGPRGKGGTVIAVTTRPPRASDMPISPEELGKLLGALDEIGLFELAGRPEAPAEIPPGSIAVDAAERKFFVTLQDLRTDEDSRRFSRAAYRIVAATQAGPHYSLPK